ncbi:hypothetical protein SNE40_017178 [Patella caerulea]|uniref:Eukaryotic translation initiation factor 5B n=1 Tax=Patella caerulea TaxID=87958 RepID=A0AAN8JEH8_PATCE
MGKPKKGQKGVGNDDFDDDDIEVDPLANMAEHKESGPAKTKASKRDKRKKKGDDWEDDVAADIAALSLDKDDIEDDEFSTKSLPKTKEKKKKSKKVESDEDDDDDEKDDEVKVVNKKKPVSFASLGLFGNDDDDDDDEDDKESEKEEEKPVKIIEEPVVQDGANKKKRDKKKKKGKEDDFDIDAFVADLDSKDNKGSKKKKGKKGESKDNDEDAGEVEVKPEVEKVEPQVMSIEDIDESYYEKDKKKKKKKEKKEKTEDGDEEGEMKDGEGNEDGESTVKSAAQKKKEKKEREKEKKRLEKEKEKKKKKVEKETDGKDDVKTEETQEGEVQEVKMEIDENKEESKDGENKKGEEEEKTEESTKSKKKKKKDKEKDGKDDKEKKDEKKKPNKQIKMIQEMLRLKKEAEEEAKREEEEFERKEEERLRLLEEEKAKKDEERRIRKEAEKARKEQLKAEGKFLTKKQEEDQRKLQQMLEALKLQGYKIPNKDQTKKTPPVYEDRRRRNQKQKQSQKEKTPTEEKPSTSIADLEKTKVEEKAKVEEVKVVEEAEDVKGAWDESSGEEDAETEEISKTEVKETPPPSKPEIKKEVKKEEKKVVEVEEESEEESSSEEESETESSDEESDEDSSDEEDKSPIERARERIIKRHEAAEKKRNTDNLRAPVVCVLGHVDTGKTKILDKLRRTHVQDGEAGGITQQIGATNVPHDAIVEQTKMCKEFHKSPLKLPGLLIIDTPGHESFSNLRTRGSSLCDIAILVIDIMHGVEPQTLESINLLKERKTPFVVALNKVDRLYQWKTMPQQDIANVIKKQSPNVKLEFEKRVNEVIVQLANESLNACLSFENKNPKEYISLVPTSAHSGDGMGNLIALICELSQTLLAKRISYSEELHATVMEVKAIHGLGTTIDVILVNGVIREGETIVIAGTEGPITTSIRGLLMPQPMKELRVKNQYEHHKEVHAAQGVKIIAKDMEKAMAGLPLYVAHNSDEVDYYVKEIAIVLEDVLKSIKLTDKGVFVQASTLGSLEALLEFLRTSKIPYAGINIGPVHKKDIMKASAMLEHDGQYACVLAFDVKVERESQELADKLGVRVFTADIIYHLFDRFMEYREEVKKKKQEEFKHLAVFPCKLRILPQFIFNTRNPIVVGVVVEAGFIKEGAPLCVPSKEFCDLGRITSIEVNKKSVDIARQGMEVCIKIEPLPGQAPRLLGKHFTAEDMLVSKISRDTIDVVKNYFRDDMQKNDWMLILELKKLFEII